MDAQTTKDALMATLLAPPDVIDFTGDITAGDPRLATSGQPGDIGTRTITMTTEPRKKRYRATYRPRCGLCVLV